MDALTTVLETIKGVIASFKAFFEDIAKMFTENK